MGRHSAPDEIAAAAGTGVVSAAATATLPAVFTELRLPLAEAAAVPTEAEGTVGNLVDAAVSPSRADLNLLKAVPGLRAQALAGVVVPYLLYTLVMVLLGRTDIYLIWFWVPTVLAGALVGHLLDRAHSELKTRASTGS